jgi:hypothetical protein
MPQQSITQLASQALIRTFPLLSTLMTPNKPKCRLSGAHRDYRMSTPS